MKWSFRRRINPAKTLTGWHPGITAKKKEMEFTLMSPYELRRALEDAAIEIERLKTDPTFGILTRVAIDMDPPVVGAVIFWDIDEMSRLNSSLGYEGVDARIRAACAQIRKDRCCLLVARWYSGDEFIYNCAEADALGAAIRIRAVFADQGIGVTMGVAEIEAGNFLGAVETASGKVQAAKSRGSRGTISV